MRIYAAKAVLAKGVHPAVLDIEDGKITKLAVGDQSRSTDADVVIESGYLAPGLIDLQLNGAFGTDFAAANEADWDRILKSLPATGVTSVYPTVITAPIDELVDFFKKNQNQVGDGTVRTSVLGFHLEGPFLNLVRRGAHREQWVVEPNDKSVSEIISAASNSLKIVTIAPELPGATAAIKSFVSNDIKVSVGHSDANAETVAKAADLGATLITHLFNAQSQIGHRNTGV
ncbi:MAG: N-acetylglucosamine-6-phosphate deacetylase, partial [Candidatus Nanopelagicales bacterium]